jgi:serine/threonine-protein kinase HipA
VFRYDELGRTWTLALAFDLTPSVYLVLVGLAWLGGMQIPTRFEAVLRLAELGGVSARVARAIYGEVEAATLGGWSAAATRAGVPVPMIRYWEREMIRQTQDLRDSARRHTRPKPGRG